MISLASVTWQDPMRFFSVVGVSTCGTDASDDRTRWNPRSNMPGLKRQTQLKKLMNLAGIEITGNDTFHAF